MFNFKVEIDLKPLEDMQKKMVNKILRGATRKACRIVLKEAKSNTKRLKRTGFMSKSMIIKIRTYPNGITGVIKDDKNAVMSLGTYSRGKHKGENKLYRPSKILHIVERGGKHSQGKHPMQRAMDAKLEEFRNELVSQIAESIRKELDKA